MNKDGKREIILVGTNFVPLHGGIAQYTLQLAKFLNRDNRLKFVLTHHHQKIQYLFQIINIKNKYFRNRELGKRMGDNIPFVRKFNSLVYTIYIHCFYIIHFFAYFIINNNYEWVFTSLYGFNNRILIELLLLRNQSFSIVFHGLDIIEFSINRKNFMFRIINSRSNLYTNSSATKNLLNSYYPNSRSKKINTFYPLIDTDNISSLTSINLEEIEKSLGITLDKKFKLRVDI